MESTIGALPRLSIGVPVFNGQDHLAAAIGALLDQSFSDFELIISDNASTDRTAEICRAFAATDERIRLIRNERNLGAAANYNQTLERARGELFKWAAHDDICLPRFLERCINVLDTEPDTVLVHSLSCAIDQRGRTLGRYPHEQAFDQARASQRFRAVILPPHLCIAVFGVMRREILLRTVRHGDWVGADRNLLAELSLHGKIRLVPEQLFQRRHHAQASIHRFTDEHERLAWFDPDKSGSISFPTWRRLGEYLRAIARARPGVRASLGCCGQLLRWLVSPHHTGPRNIRLLAFELLRPRRA
jgi:glycosyltransferase involved in cell wall biosynthesis